MTQKGKKTFYRTDISPPGYAFEGWVSWIYGEKETPQGIRWHYSRHGHFYVIDLVTGEYVGKGLHTRAYNGLRDDDEDIKIEETIVVNRPGRGRQGIEIRVKILLVMQNGEVKVQIGPPKPFVPPDP